MQKSTLGVALAAAGCAAVFAISNAGKAPSDELDYLAATGARNEIFDALNATLDRVLGQGGLGMQGAEFFLLQPFEDIAITSELGVSATGMRQFWYTPHQHEPHTYYPTFPLSAVPLGLSPLFPRVIGQYHAQESSPGSSLYSVFVSFDQRAVSVLASLHGPITSSASFKDWYGFLHPQGGAATEMRAVVASGNKALLPFSVTQIVAGGVPDTVELARDLTAAEAAELVESLTR